MDLSAQSSSTEDEEEVGPIWISDDEGKLWEPQNKEVPPDQRPGRPGRVSCFKLAVRPYRHLQQHSTKVLGLAQELDLEVLATSVEDAMNEIPCDDSSWANLSTYEQPCKVVMSNASQVAELQERWTDSSLLELYGELRFSIKRKSFDWGPFEVDGRLQLKYYLRMLRKYADVDWPLYLFEYTFEEGRESLLSDWSRVIPTCFSGPNALWHVPESHRPPGRYFLVGSKRSGSYIHKDPCETAAWNLLLHGRKRWAILPPHVPRQIVEPFLFSCSDKRLLNRCPGAWFHFVLPNLRNMELGLIEFTQLPGETVFVPRGWWHAVLNLDDYCVCATENFIVAPIVEPALESMRSDEPSVAEQWAADLMSHGWSRKAIRRNNDPPGEKQQFLWNAPTNDLEHCVAQSPASP